MRWEAMGRVGKRCEEQLVAGAHQYSARSDRLRNQGALTSMASPFLVPRLISIGPSPSWAAAADGAAATDEAAAAADAGDGSKAEHPTELATLPGLECAGKEGRTGARRGTKPTTHGGSGVPRIVLPHYSHPIPTKRLTTHASYTFPNLHFHSEKYYLKILEAI